jgi:DnaJ-class molecular chaperone
MQLQFKDADSFEEAKAFIESLFLQPCPSCDGTGRLPAPQLSSTKTCDTCKGEGKTTNHLADALIEFLQERGDFARENHDHTFTTRNDY